MASLRDIKIRIRSVKSTQKITKAMEMIAASKMKRAQQQALKGRPYLSKLKEIVANLVSLSEPKLKHPFLEKRTDLLNQNKEAELVRSAHSQNAVSNASRCVCYVFITANRGLCGGYNTNVIRAMLEVLREKNNREEIILTVGRKGRQAMERIGKKVLADFETISDKPTFLDTVGITKVVVEDFLAGKLDEVYMVYNHFYSAASQRPVITKLLPIESDESFSNEKGKGIPPGRDNSLPGPPAADAASASLRRSDYIFEPNKELLLDELLNRFVETTVYQTILESVASEHSARMMAMHQASENAHDIVSNLTLHYNKGRQAKITKEILEVVAGSN